MPQVGAIGAAMPQVDVAENKTKTIRVYKTWCPLGECSKGKSQFKKKSAEAVRSAVVHHLKQSPYHSDVTDEEAEQLGTLIEVVSDDEEAWEDEDEGGWWDKRSKREASEQQCPLHVKLAQASRAAVSAQSTMARSSHNSAMDRLMAITAGGGGAPRIDVANQVTSWPSTASRWWRARRH